MLDKAFNIQVYIATTLRSTVQIVGLSILVYVIMFMFIQ